MEITTEMVKDLRDKTGVSVMQCKKALEESGGDVEQAIALLQKKSAESASKKADRTLGAGAIEAYIHSTGTVGAMVELLCETDFVAKNDEFKKLARDIAMHVSALNPEFLKVEDVSAESQQANPDWQSGVLLDQPFIKNPDQTIRTLIEIAVQKFGEKMELSRFARFSVTQ